MIRSGIARGKDEAAENHGGVADALGLKLEDLRRYRINAIRYVKDYWQVALPAAVKLLEHPEEVKRGFAGEPGLFEVFCDVCQAVLDAYEAGGEPDFSSKVWQARYSAKRKKQQCDVTDDILSAVFLTGPVSESIGATAMKMLFGNHAPAVEDFARNTAAAQGWPELVPLSGLQPEIIVPALDLPGICGEIAASLQEFVCVPGELPALMALGVASVAVHGRWDVEVKAGYSEPLSLWACCVLPSASNKTAVLSALMDPLSAWEQRKRAELAPLISAAVSERKTAEARIAKLRSQAGAEANAEARAEIAREISAMESNLPKVPVSPELFTADCTPEKLAVLMSQQGGRIAVLCDEPGLFATAGGRYSRGIANLDVYLSGHSGKFCRVHRNSREAIDIPRSHLSMAITAQPGVLESLGENDEFRDRGFLARFLWVVPKPNLGFRHLDGKPVPANVSEAWGRILTALLDKEPDVDDAGNVIPKTIRLSREALRAWKTEWQVNEKEMRPDGPWGDDAIRSWAGKYCGAVARIAAVLHCTMCRPGCNPEDQPISEGLMQAAIKLGRKLKTHALRAFGMAKLSPDLKMATKIVAWIRREDIQEFTSRDCTIGCARGGKVSAVVGALEILANHGWIRQGEPKKADSGRGREFVPWVVNPLVQCLEDADSADGNRSVGGHLGIVSAVSADFELAESSEDSGAGIVSAVSASFQSAKVPVVVSGEDIEWAANACRGGGR